VGVLDAIVVPPPGAVFVPTPDRAHLGAVRWQAKRFHQKRTVSGLTSIPRSCGRSPTFRGERGNRA
jgi:hypothetical protein